MPSSRPSGPSALYVEMRLRLPAILVQIVPGVAEPHARVGRRRNTSSTVNASPGCALDCSRRRPNVEPARTACADSTNTVPLPAGGSLNEVAVSLTIAPVVPTRSRRTIRAGLPADDADAADTVAYAMNGSRANVERTVGRLPPTESEIV